MPILGLGDHHYLLGGLESFNWTNYVFYFLSAELFFTLCCEQNIHFFRNVFFLSAKLDTKLGLISIDLEVKERSEARLHKFEDHLMMLSEARQK